MQARSGHSCDSENTDGAHVARVRHGPDHAGSTAIPGIVAKPIIDMIPLIRRFDDGAACVAPLRQLGFEYMGEYGLPGRHYFRKGEPRTHHAHMYAADHPDVGRCVRFRDFLRAHPAEAGAYDSLKRRLAVQYAEDVTAYTAAKSMFCERIERLSSGVA